ncbi:hypothetical protein [[Mycoplasma] imitans]|uniref:hypothetical protein n=1 Tax=[Mycoplasma] imitans TaxID=29560 RepID=UPI000480334F|nr:hypothetical protein [[Mycoplasma] imitans]
MDKIASKVHNLVKSNATTPQDQVMYYKQYEELEESYNKVKQKYDALLEEKEDKNIKARGIDLFINSLQDLNIDVIEFDEEMWNLLIDNMLVEKDKSMLFRFKSGIEIKVEAGK